MVNYSVTMSGARTSAGALVAFVRRTITLPLRLNAQL